LLLSTLTFIHQSDDESLWCLQVTFLLAICYVCVPSGGNQHTQ
jgi:hypothetical protein